MNSTLAKMLPRIEAWPDEDQEALAEAARAIEAERTGVYVLSEDENRAIELGMEAARRGDFATDEDLAALFRKARGV